MSLILGRNVLRRPWSAAVQRWLARPFAGRPRRACVIFYERNRISFSQVYPFLHYARELWSRFGAQVRFVPQERLGSPRALPHKTVNVALLQTWFTVEQQQLAAMIARLRAAHPDAEISFLDSFAHNDLRLGSALGEHVKFYFKKSIFRDSDLYFEMFRGDTNLTQYYGDMFGCAGAPQRWDPPSSLIGKLRLFPNFFTAPEMIDRFERGDRSLWAQTRDIDVHARLALTGAPWYAAMRRRSIEALPAGLTVVEGSGLPWRAFVAELGRSKLCLSPFGYGEICWRDVEAAMTGAALVKPDMGHLRTLPDIYEQDATYAATRWDFNDQSDVVASLLADPARRAGMAEQAFARIHDYLRDRRFVDDMAPLFD